MTKRSNEKQAGAGGGSSTEKIAGGQQVKISDGIRADIAACADFMGTPVVKGNIVEIGLKGKILDDRQIQRFGGALLGLANDNPGATIVLEQANLRYLSSAALTKLITAKRKLDQSNGRLVMRNVQQDVMDVHRIAQLDKYFIFENDEKDE